MSGRIMLDSAEERRAQQAPEEPKPPPEPQEPPPPAPVEPPPAPEAPLAAEPVEDTPEPELSPAAKARIDALTRQKYDALSRLGQIQREWQAFQAQQRAAQIPPGQSDARAEAVQQLRQEQTEAQFVGACNEVYRKGLAEYADFGQAVEALNAVGYDPRVRPDAVAYIASMPDGHHVWRALAQDLDNAARVLNLPAPGMFRELTEMEYRHRTAAAASAAPVAAPAVPVSRAPAPLRPVGGTSARPEKSIYDPTISIGEYIRRKDREESGGSRRIMR